MVIFGASGDLTKRLLVPALYNLACDGLLSENFAVVGTAIEAWTTESFRELPERPRSGSSTRARSSTRWSGTSS